MEGRSRAAKRNMERDVVLAWDVARMSIDGQSKRGLRNLKHYLNELKPKAASGNQAFIDYFRAMRKKGVPVKITRLKPTSSRPGSD